MSKNGTIEINHTNFINMLDAVGESIELINKIIEQTNKQEILKNRTLNIKFTRASKMYEDIKDDYGLNVVDILSNYYTTSGGKKNNSEHISNKDINDEYSNCITGENYFGKLKQCIETIKVFYSCLEKFKQEYKNGELKKLKSFVSKFNRSKINTNIKQIDYDICSCGTKMVIYPEKSELMCQNCGKTITLYGTVFEDTQFYNQEGQRSKHGCYDPSRHCKFWVSRIQAKENMDIPKDIVDAITVCIKRDGIKDCRRLMCNNIRNYLKEISKTEYNDHIPLIKKIIIGSAPPQLTEDELRKLYNLFDKSVNAFELIKPDEKSNTMYYPYIIYKILDNIIPNGVRKKRILECIHLQSRETLIANDNMWEKICKIVTSLNYKPTDRNEQKIYI